MKIVFYFFIYLFFFIFQADEKLRSLGIEYKDLKLEVCIYYIFFIYFYCFFYSLLFRDASTSLVISHLGSLDVYQKALYFYCCVVNVSFVKFSDFIFMIYGFDE